MSKRKFTHEQMAAQMIRNHEESVRAAIQESMKK